MRGSNPKEPCSGGEILVCGTSTRVVGVFVAQISSAIIVTDIVQKYQLKITSSF